MTRVLRLTLLAPDIIKAILDGKQGIVGDRIIDHLDENGIADFRDGDHVVGVLPSELVARLCEIGVICQVLVVSPGRARRGTEMTAEDLTRADARLVRIRAELE